MLLAVALAAPMSDPPSSGKAGDEPAMSREIGEEDEVWTALFDGRSLDGWRGNPRFWSVEDGCIVGRSTPQNPCEITTYLHHERPYRDFVLEFEIKLEGDGANSGMQYRSKPEPGRGGDGTDLSGYQADIDARHTYTGILYETYGRGIAVGRGQAIRFDADRTKREIEPARPDAELKAHLRKVDNDPETEGWHRYRVVADGRRLEHWIDGERVVLAEDHHPAFAPEGIFALQVHSGPPMTVRVRNLRLRDLTPRTSAHRKPPTEQASPGPPTPR